MRASWKLFRVFGIEVRVHITFLLIVAYFAYLWGRVYEPGGWVGAAYGVLMVILLFGLVTIHELTHSRVAQHYGVKVAGITLLPIGGMAQMEEIPREPRKELFISVAGPLSNIAIALLMFVGALFLLSAEELTVEGLTDLLLQRSFRGAYVYLMLVNLTLAAFNLLPAFPLDGGRVFRALLALKLGRERATRTAVVVGQALALALGLWGLLGGGIFLLLVAVFIFLGASGEGQGAETGRVLGSVRVGQAVNAGVEYARPGQVVGELAARLFHTYQTDFLVVDAEERLVGLVTRDMLIRALSQHGRFYPVAQAMMVDFPSLAPQDSLLDAFNSMRAAGTKAAAVVDEGRLVGMLSMEDISEAFSLLAAGGSDLAAEVGAVNARFHPLAGGGPQRPV
ncbi:MAG: site-2 protease family protein [Gaiellales bacterium]|nr:site-2 protease family protein [Gaiellales bacterium]